MVYIALEGLKGAGKTTAIEYVSAVLKQRRITPAILAPTRPMPDDVWWERAYAHFGSEDAFREALYAARSNYHASKINRHAPLILGDRSIITSLAIRWHQDADKERRIKHVRQSEYLIPMPDWVIQLDVSDEELLRRYHSRNRCYGTDEVKSGIHQTNTQQLLPIAALFDNTIRQAPMAGFGLHPSQP
nr:hypothetical protein LVJ77_01435 [Conchiformibius kuhniae]